MKLTTLQSIANRLGYILNEIPDEETKAYSVNDGELEIWETDEEVKIKTIGGERGAGRNYFQLIGFKYHPATMWEPADQSDYIIGKYDGLTEAFRQACIHLATKRIDDVAESEALNEIFSEEISEIY
jgi:hypothetical protein